MGYTVEEAKREIKDSIEIYLEKREDGTYCMPEVNRLPFYLQGAPGVGKTEMSRQIAEEMGIGFVALSVTHHTRNTVLGLPVVENLKEKDSKYTVYTMSEIIAMVEREVGKGYKEGILLIDEFACMAESLVAPMLAFLQTKNIGTYRLPEGWVLILCSNPVKYNKSARVFDMAIMDRVRLMDVEFDTKTFIKYGEEHGIHHLILDYLKLYPADAHLCEVAENGERSIVTTRGWENLSWCMQGCERKRKSVTQALIQQFVKNFEIADRFYRFYLTHRGKLDQHAYEEILEGKNLPYWTDCCQTMSFQERYMMTELLCNSVIEECREFEEEVDLKHYFEEVADFYQEKPHAFISLEDFWEKRKKGGVLFPNDKRGNCSGKEAEAWKTILSTVEEQNCITMENIAKLLKPQVQCASNEKMIALFSEASSEYWQDQESKREGRMKNCSERIGHVCEFVGGLDENSRLMDILMSRLNKSLGVLDVMSACENPAYLKYNEEICAGEAIVKQIRQEIQAERKEA